MATKKLEYNNIALRLNLVLIPYECRQKVYELHDKYHTLHGKIGTEYYTNILLNNDFKLLLVDGYYTPYTPESWECVYNYFKSMANNYVKKSNKRKVE